jgi:hypothetical protein
MINFVKSPWQYLGSSGPVPCLLTLHIYSANCATMVQSVSQHSYLRGDPEKGGRNEQSICDAVSIRVFERRRMGNTDNVKE